MGSKGSDITEALIEKMQEQLAAQASINARIARLQYKLTEHEKILNALHETAKAFGIDLIKQLPFEPTTEKTGWTIRQYVFQRAMESYPNPVRATPLRQEMETLRGAEIHEKTIGMTLYRLLQEGVLRRDKRDWFFVPEADRNKEKPSKASLEGLTS